MLDYKDVPNGFVRESRSRWRGRLLILVAMLTLLGGFGFLALDTLKVRSDRNPSAGPAPAAVGPSASGPAPLAEQPDAPEPEPQPEPEPVEKQEKSAKPVPQAEKPSDERRIDHKREADPEVDSAEPPEPGKKVGAASRKEGAGGQPKQQAVEKPEEPHYDFYTLLPNYEVVIPEEEINPPKPVVETRPVEPIKLNEGAAYLLQVGSFRTEPQAEDTRGRLALLGFEASIHESVSGDKTWFRVRLGPYRDSSELNDVRALLIAEGFSALPLRLRQPN